MTKIRKQKRKKKFRYASKKKLKRKFDKKPNIPCEAIKKEWEDGKSVMKNIEEMGLVYDVNKSMIPSNREEAEDASVSSTEKKKLPPSKTRVVEILEQEAHAPRESKFRLPEGQVRWLSYLISKYGEDYKAMARDPKNHYAETWKQIRAKINTFKKIPTQYDEFLKSQENISMDTSN